jgi:hypothetical protein
MLNRGIPETPEEALEITSLIADQTPNDPVPPHWPHSQVVAIAQVVRTQQEIIAVLAEQVELVLARCDKLKDKLIELAGTTDGMEDEPPAAPVIADSTDPDESAPAEATDVAGDQKSDEPTPEPTPVAKRGGRQRVAA